MPRDRRIFEVRGEYALMRSSDVPDGMPRGKGAGFTAPTPTTGQVDDAIQRFKDDPSYAHDPGSSFDLVAVKAEGLRARGWQVDDGAVGRDPRILEVHGDHAVVRAEEVPDGVARSPREVWEETPVAAHVVRRMIERLEKGDEYIGPGGKNALVAVRLADLRSNGWTTDAVEQKKPEPTERDRRLIEVHGEFAIIDSKDVPAGMTRSGGEFTSSRPVPDSVVRRMIRSVSEGSNTYRGAGLAGDLVAVSLADLERSGWVTKDSKGPPVLRTTGKSLISQLAEGEAYRSSPNGDRTIMSKEYPNDLPFGWSYATTGTKLLDHYGEVSIVPSYRQPTVLRTSGRARPSTLAVGEAYRNQQGESVIITVSNSPEDMPMGWRWLGVGMQSAYGDVEVEIIPSYRISGGIRTSGRVKRRDLRAGEAYLHEDGDKVIVRAEHGLPRDLPSNGWAYDTLRDVREIDPEDEVQLIPPYTAAPETKSKSETRVEATFKHMNSGRTYSFVTGKNPIDLTVGWKPTDLAGEGKSLAFDPVAPVMAVHDLMEHFPGDEYDPHNEYQAQGAMLWLRYEGNFFPDQRATTLVSSVVKPAFGMLFYHINKHKLETREYDGPTMDPFKLMARPTAYALMELIIGAKRLIEAEYSTRDRLETSLGRSIPWIVKGYVRAAERYQGLNKSNLVRLYKGTVAQIDKPIDGSTLKLTMDYEKYTSQVELSVVVKV